MSPFRSRNGGSRTTTAALIPADRVDAISSIPVVIRSDPEVQPPGRHASREIFIRTSIGLMTTFVNLNDQEFVTTPVEMWNEVFTAWAAIHGRVDPDSSEQLDEYTQFLRASIWHLKELRDGARGDSLNEQRRKHSERILTGIFTHVAQTIDLAERRAAGGKMPRGKESAVLGREELVRLLDDDVALLDEAVRRQRKTS
jgi:hypothetical protein